MPKPKNRAVLAILITATVVLLVGMLILQGRLLIPEPTSWPRTDYNQLISIMTFAGDALIGIAVMSLVLLGWVVALMRTDLSDGVRRNALIATAIMMAAWLIFSYISSI